MLMEVRVSAGLAVSAFLFLLSARAQELTEPEAVKRFLAQSPQGKELEARVSAVRAETRSWSLWPNPAVGYSHEGAGLNEFVQVEQPLPVNGRLRLMRQAGAAAVNVAQSRSSYSLWELTSDMRLAFHALLLAQEREAAMHLALNALQEIVRILREREKQAEGSTFDRLRGEREQAELRTELFSAEVLTAQARSRLASFFASGMIPDSLRVRGELRNPAQLPAFAELLTRALEIRADYKAERQQLEQFQFEQRAATRLRIPDPVLNAGMKRAELLTESIGFGPFVAVSVPLPIFNRGQTEVARLRAESERTQARRQVIEQRIRTELEAAYATVQLRRRAAEQYQRELEAQGLQLDQIAQTAYQEGELGILELLDAYRVSRQSKFRAIDLWAAARQAEIELERTAGEPVLHKEVLP